MKCPCQMEDYFRYFPIPSGPLKWGLALSAAGFTRIPAESPYPPAQHPEDHALEWHHGRVIEALQLVIITEGSGCLETRALGQQRVEAGMVFLLLPNTWHRYRPDPETGWTESWIEVRGPVVDELLQKNTFPEDAILKHGGLDAGIEETLRRVHLSIADDERGNSPELAALGLQLLAQFDGIHEDKARLPSTERAIRRAERYLNDHYRAPMAMEELAAELGIAYSYFRRVFRTHSGFTPWRYVIRLRLTQARTLMASSQATLDDIAAQTGFSSGFHLSTSFKQAYGTAPSLWRKALIRDAGPGA